MFNGSNCDRKSQLCGILTELLNPRGIFPISQLHPPPLYLPRESSPLNYINRNIETILKFLKVCFYVTNITNKDFNIGNNDNFNNYPFDNDNIHNKHKNMIIKNLFFTGHAFRGVLFLTFINFF